MKHKIFLPVFVSAIFVLQCSNASAQIIPNSGFENWTVDIWDNCNPDNWETSNGDYQPAKITCSYGYQSNWSLRAVNYGGGSFAYAKCKFLVLNHPTSLNAYVKTEFMSIDSVNIQISIYHNGIAVDSGKWINTNLSPIAVWTPVSIPISQFTTSVDSVEIQINGGVEPGTSLYVDDLTFSYATSTNEIQTAHLLGSYISPDLTGNNFLNLNISSPSSFTLNIFSADGKNVFSQNYSLAYGAHKIVLPTENLGQGIYFCRLMGEGVNKAFKFIKEK
jgi:hypothetical protein